MTRNGTSRIGPANRRPQNVTEVLCNELGASHPDGALRQIRTMKRVLRKHYEAQKRLERFGVSTAMDAAASMADLRAKLRIEREGRRERARANVRTIDAALDALTEARERLRDLARPPDAIDRSPSGPDTSPTANSAHGSMNPSPARRSPADGPSLDGSSGEEPEGTKRPSGKAPDGSRASSDPSLDIFEAVSKQLDELRLELWLEAGRPEASESGVDAVLDRLHDRVQALSEENESLRAELARLKTASTASHS